MLLEPSNIPDQHPSETWVVEKNGKYNYHKVIVALTILHAGGRVSPTPLIHIPEKAALITYEPKNKYCAEEKDWIMFLYGKQLGTPVLSVGSKGRLERNQQPLADPRPGFLRHV